MTAVMTQQSYYQIKFWLLYSVRGCSGLNRMFLLAPVLMCIFIKDALKTFFRRTSGVKLWNIINKRLVISHLQKASTKRYGGNFRRRLAYFSHCLPLCMGNGSPPPWDPVGTGNFWPVLAACPLPQARLRQQHFRECLSTGGESEKETNSRGPRRLRQAWEWFEKKRCMRQSWICHWCANPSLHTDNQMHCINMTWGEKGVFSPLQPRDITVFQQEKDTFTVHCMSFYANVSLYYIC